MEEQLNHMRVEFSFIKLNELTIRMLPCLRYHYKIKNFDYYALVKSLKGKLYCVMLIMIDNC